jgi:hypothetical protein
MAHLVRRLLAVGAASALLWPLSLGAQARERVAYVSVVERATAQPVAELSPADVIIREDGVRREVLRITKATGPMHIAVLVDNSAAAESAIPNIRDGPPASSLAWATWDRSRWSRWPTARRWSPTTPPTPPC